MGYPFPQGFAGSNPARSTFTATCPTFDIELLTDILKVEQHMRANGNAESKIESTIRRLKFLGKNTNLGIPQICKDYITNYNTSNVYKEGLNHPTFQQRGWKGKF